MGEIIFAFSVIGGFFWAMHSRNQEETSENGDNQENESSERITPQSRTNNTGETLNDKIFIHGDDRLDCIIPEFLWLGNLFESRCMRLLMQDRIDVIMNCTSTLKNVFPNKFQYKRFAVKDNFSDADLIFSMFQDATDFLQQMKREKKRVFVHCAQGVSRSVTLVLAYMIADQKISFEKSLRIVRLHREQAQPNIAFSLKLRVWERQQLQLPRTSVKDSIKQLSDVYWNTELEKDAISLIKANVMATKTSEEEFAETICQSFDWDEARIRAVYRALHSLSDTVNVPKVLSLVTNSMEDLSLDVPLVGMMFTTYFLSPALVHKLISELQIRTMIEGLPEKLRKQIENRLQIEKFHSDADIIN